MLKYYRILDIPEISPQAVVEAAYRKQCKACHPDKVNHLGSEFKNLASAKMVLLNEAYRILGNPISRKKYNHNPESFHSPGFFTICRNCGCPYWLLEYQELQSLECTSCGESLYTGSITPKTRLWKDISPILHYLRLSHQSAGPAHLPSSLQITYLSHPITLDMMNDGRWCLFTQSESIHKKWRLYGFKGVQKWDEDLATGFCFFSGSDFSEMSDVFNKIIPASLPVDDINAMLTPTNRKDGAAEPNIMLISALSDKSLVTAAELWKVSGGNLFACKADAAPGWESRLEKLYRMVHYPKRKRSSSRSRIIPSFTEF